jgi:hypothetical protein
MPFPRASGDSAFVVDMTPNDLWPILVVAAGVVGAYVLYLAFASELTHAVF